MLSVNIKLKYKQQIMDGILILQIAMARILLFSVQDHVQFQC